jgi:hypothetical protein
MLGFVLIRGKAELYAAPYAIPRINVCSEKDQLRACFADVSALQDLSKNRASDTHCESMLHVSLLFKKLNFLIESNLLHVMDLSIHDLMEMRRHLWSPAFSCV